MQAIDLYLYNVRSLVCINKNCPLNINAVDKNKVADTGYWVGDTSCIYIKSLDLRR